MKLAEVLAGTPLLADLSPELAQTEVTGLEYDSRKVASGFVFFAFPGAKADGNAFAEQARAKGAVAVISEQNGRQILAIAAKNFYGNLDEKLNLTGVTGTNGKTTTSYLIDSILREACFTTAMIGTIEYHLGSKVLPAPNTTPESLDLQRIFADLHAIAGTHVTMEVSSHALALGRVHGLNFHTAVFTNLTQDHLDFHQTMEAYFEAKKLLFKSPRYSVINRDDEWGRKLIDVGNPSEVLWYGLGHDAMVRARQIDSSFAGLRFEVVHDKFRFEIQSPLIGKINVYNILAACSAAMTYQLPPEVIVRGIAACKGVAGRFERVDEGQPFAVVVDYSHTDDALKNAISVARTLNPKRVITVFGCGGDRDHTKRPIMGQVAGQLSDLVIVTSDNPRSEDPLQIINDIMVGVRRTDTRIIVEPDRAAAIRKAIGEAQSGDIVLLAGKGHETYQIFREKTIHFDDREVAREALKGFGYHS